LFLYSFATFQLNFLNFIKKIPLISVNMDFSDPAAEFLSREREQLGDLINDDESK
jgi:hypothetical protein